MTNDQVKSVCILDTLFPLFFLQFSTDAGRLCVFVQKFNRLLNSLADWNDADFAMGQQQLQSFERELLEIDKFCFQKWMRISYAHVLLMFAGFQEMPPYSMTRCWISIQYGNDYFPQHPPFSIFGSTGCDHCICAAENHWKPWPWSWGIATATQLQARKIVHGVAGRFIPNNPIREMEELGFL